MQPLAKKFGLVAVVCTSGIVSVLLLFFFTYMFVSQRDMWCGITAPTATMMDKKETIPENMMPKESVPQMNR